MNGKPFLSEILTGIAALFTLFGLMSCGFSGGEGSRNTSEGDRLNKMFSMVYVQGGTFLMGCTVEQEDDCWSDEEPVHPVTLSDFYIGKYQVTQEQWMAVMGVNNPSAFKGDNLPVERVSWNDVQEFIRRLNEMTGGNYRLPTESEWEYAARGGIQSRGYKYSGSDNVDEVAWYRNNSGFKTHPVGTKKANELGIYDMSGNVAEWVDDWASEYDDLPHWNPRGPSIGWDRVFRGGSWNYGAQNARVSIRDYDDPGSRGGNLGFRIVRSVR